MKQHSVLSGDETLKQSDSEQQGCSEPQDAQQGHRGEQEAAHSSWRFLGSEYSLGSGRGRQRDLETFSTATLIELSGIVSLGNSPVSEILSVTT